MKKILTVFSLMVAFVMMTFWSPAHSFLTIGANNSTSYPEFHPVNNNTSATKATLSLSCRPEFDSLVVDQPGGDYEVNPFKVYLMVTNNNQLPADSVEATLMLLSPDVTISAPSVATMLLAERLNPGDSIPVEASWFLRAVPRLSSGDVQVMIIVRAKGLAALQCIVTIYIPEIGRPVLDCNGTITTNVTDNAYDMTLSFDQSIGDFEGEKSIHGNYNVFTLSVAVHNIGEAQANNVRVILTPDGASFDDGESASKSTLPVDIPENGFGQASWKLRPLRQADYADRTFKIEVISENANLSNCTYTMTIQGAPKNVFVTIPNDLVGKYGDNIAVPIYIGPTIGTDLHIYKLNVKFDPDIVSFLIATSANTQTQFGWNGPQTMLLKSDPALEHDVVRVKDFTTGAPLNSKNEDVLVYLIFEAIYSNENGTKPDFAFSVLEIITSLTADGKTYTSSMNSFVDDQDGDITLSRHDGMVTVSGVVGIEPLNESLKFQLAQNFPNPFNPETSIQYAVPENSSVQLRVYNALGELVVELVNEGNQTEGILYRYVWRRRACKRYLHRCHQHGRQQFRYQLQQVYQHDPLEISCC